MDKRYYALADKLLAQDNNEPTEEQRLHNGLYAGDLALSYFNGMAAVKPGDSTFEPDKDLLTMAIAERGLGSIIAWSIAWADFQTLVRQTRPGDHYQLLSAIDQSSNEWLGGPEADHNSIMNAKSIEQAMIAVMIYASFTGQDTGAIDAERMFNAIDRHMGNKMIHNSPAVTRRCFNVGAIAAGIKTNI